MKFIIATHGYLADGYISAIRVLTGKDGLYAVNAYTEEMFDVFERLQELIDTFDEKEDVMIFTDVISGSTTQSASRLLMRPHTHCITGINLPLVLELVLAEKPMEVSCIRQMLEEAKEQMIYIDCCSGQDKE